MNKCINYICAICGGRKTTAAIAHVIAGIKSNQKFIIFQPTTELNGSTFERFDPALRQNGTVRVINSQNVPQGQTVTGVLNQVLKSPGKCRVIICTFEAAVRLKRRRCRSWNAIVDEVPEAFTVTSIQSRRVATDLLGLLDFKACEHEDYLKVTIQKGKANALRKLVQDSMTDTALKALEQTAQSLMKDQSTYVSKSVYDTFINANGASIGFYHIMRPGVFSHYKSTTMMAANFEESILYRVWKGKYGVRFKSQTGFSGSSGSLPTQHDRSVGEKLDIYYLMDHYSMQRKKDTNVLKVVQDESRRAIEQIFAGNDFIYTQNSGDNRGSLNGVSGTHFVLPKAHGSNEYRDVNCVAVLGIFNLSADRVGFLKKICGIPEEVSWNTLNKEYAYQFACRSSLRDVPSAQSSIQPKKVIVLVKSMADYLHEKFPGSRVHKFQSDKIDALEVVPRGRKASSGEVQSDAARKQKSRMKLKKENLEKNLELLKCRREPRSDLMNLDQEKCHVITLRDKECDIREWSFALMGNVKEIRPKNETCDSFSTIVEVLRNWSENVIGKKEENILFNCTKFTSENGVCLGRRLKDVITSDAILMDMDSEKNCDPDEFAGFMSGIEFVSYSSFSSSLERRRWRVIIPLSRPVSASEYRQIASDLLAISGEHGFPFDKKKAANDFMYLPGIGLNPDAAFFKHVKGEGRGYLPVDFWLKGNAHEARETSASALGDVLDLAA